jgi:hypothetical protein
LKAPWLAGMEQYCCRPHGFRDGLS